jgi:hypothetical protein
LLVGAASTPSVFVYDINFDKPGFLIDPKVKRTTGPLIAIFHFDREFAGFEKMYPTCTSTATSDFCFTEAVFNQVILPLGGRFLFSVYDNLTNGAILINPSTDKSSPFRDAEVVTTFKIQDQPSSISSFNQFAQSADTIVNEDARFLFLSDPVEKQVRVYTMSV